MTLMFCLGLPFELKWQLCSNANSIALNQFRRGLREGLEQLERDQPLCLSPNSIIPHLFPLPSNLKMADFVKLSIFGTVFEVTTRYVDLQPVGMGAFGLVCSAKDQLTNTSVAIKKIMKPFSTPVLSKRTYRELKLLKHIRHENVSRQIKWWKVGGRVVMRWPCKRRERIRVDREMRIKRDALLSRLE